MYYLVIIFLLVEYAVIYHVPKTPPELLNKEVKAPAAVVPAEVKSDAKSEAKTEQKQQTNVEPAAPSVPEKKEGGQEAPTEQKHASVEAATPLIPAEKKEAKIEEAPAVKADVPPVKVNALQPATEQIAKKEEAPKETLRVLDVKIKNTGNLTRAEIIMDGVPLNYNVFNLDSPDRVVVDIANVMEIETKKEIAVNHPKIRKVRLGLHENKARVVFDCKGRIQPYDVTQKKDILIISFGKRP